MVEDLGRIRCVGFGWLWNGYLGLRAAGLELTVRRFMGLRIKPSYQSLSSSRLLQHCFCLVSARATTTNEL